MSHDPNQPDLNMPDLIEIDLGDAEPQPALPESSMILLPIGDEPPALSREPQVIEFPLPSDEDPPKRTRTIGNIDLETGQITEIEGPIEPAEIQTTLPNPGRLALVEARVLLERPFFALSTRPVPLLPPYTDPKGRLHLQVTAADPTKGVATLADADILIVLTSLMNANRRSSGRVNPQVHLLAATWLQLCRRHGEGGRKGGRQYRLLDEALERLRGTRITTNIGPTGQAGPTRSFSLLADWSRQGRAGLTLTAGDWLVEAVEANALLSLSPYYFDLPGGYARWLYRTARKHAGKQVGSVKMRISTLRMKSGSTSPAARFRFELKRLVTEDRLPDYRFTWLTGQPGREPMVEMEFEPDTVPWPLARECWEGRTAPEEEEGVPEEEVPF